jgi:hypothetical protein
MLFMSLNKNRLSQLFSSACLVFLALWLVGCASNSASDKATPTPPTPIAATPQSSSNDGVQRLVLPTPSQAESAGALAGEQTLQQLQAIPAVATRMAQVQAVLSQTVPVLTIEQGLDESQQLAQQLALAEPRFIEFTRSPQSKEALRNEIFGIYPTRDSDYTEKSASCRQSRCYRVEMYNYALNLSTVAIVDVEARAVLDVILLPSSQPDVPPHLAEIAQQLAIGSPEVAAALGYQPGAEEAVMANTQTALNGTRCERSRHLCVAPTFVQAERALWAIVDLTDMQLVGVRWSELGSSGSKPVTEQQIEDEVITQGFCEKENSVERDGWRFNYIITSSDGMRIADVSFQGRAVLNSAKLVDWHVSYSQREGFGYSDAIGCPTFSAAAVIPYRPPEIQEIRNVDGQAVGFVLVQEFRSDGWPLPCNYSYDQRYEFYQDGRFRVKAASVGRGCGNDGMYRPVFRIEPAGDALSFAEWNGADWKLWENEQWQLQTAQTPYSGEGHQYRFYDSNGKGYAIDPGRGQFDDGGRGDNAYLFVTRRQAERDEGEADLLTIGPCCNEDYQQGPEKYIEPSPEAIAQQAIVLWYVPQLKNDDRLGSEYCWADSIVTDGVYEVKTWPCYAGPMFVPIE